jgi:flagellar protein FlgJ
MQQGIAQAAVWHDPQGLNGLQREARENSPEALGAAAEQFEAVFVAQMLSAMRDTVPEGGLMSGRNEGMYREMMDRQVALDIASGRGFGLAEAIERQLGGRMRTAAAGQAQAEPADATGASAPVQAAASAAPASPEDFVAQMAPHARQAAAELGVDPGMLVAQAALETGWGQHTIERPDGRSSFNLFNIKAGPEWDGPKANVATLEFIDGVAERRHDDFRAYASPADSFADYVDLVRGERYADARAAAGDAEGYIRALADAGYATDPAYAEKVLAIREHAAIAEGIGDQGWLAAADTGGGAARASRAHAARAHEDQGA